MSIWAILYVTFSGMVLLSLLALAIAAMLAQLIYPEDEDPRRDGKAWRFAATLFATLVMLGLVLLVVTGAGHLIWSIFDLIP